MTKQRQLILNVVNSSCLHQTVEEIFNDEKIKESKMVFATVYNSLNYLVEHGYIRRIRIPGLPDHYDRNLEPHDHLICNQCGKVFDIPSVRTYLDKKNLDGHYLESYELIYHGICKDCLSKN